MKMANKHRNQTFGFADRLIECMENKNTSISQLAKMTGVSQANISKFETGSSRPNILTLKKIAAGLGKRLVVAFVDGEDEE